MNETHARVVAQELKIGPGQVGAVMRLLDEGGTVPFIARYRKEATGSLDEVAVAAIRDRVEKLAELDKRRGAILASLEERGLLTDALRAAVAGAADMARLEDVYLPHRPKRRTRAAMARERGLAPLAEILFAQRGVDPAKAAAPFVAPDREEGQAVPDVAAALAGARDIIAEEVCEDSRVRGAMRELFQRRGRFVSPRGQKEGRGRRGLPRLVCLGRAAAGHSGPPRVGHVSGRTGRVFVIGVAPRGRGGRGAGAASCGQG